MISITTQYIIEDDEIVGVEGEETKHSEYYNINHKDIQMLVTKEDEYYNFYIIMHPFQQTPLNNLHCQELIPAIEEDNNTKDIKRFMEERVIAFYLWNKYNRDYSIDSEEIPQ